MDNTAWWTLVWSAVAAFAAVVAAVFGGIAAWNGVADRRERRRLVESGRAQQWSLEVEGAERPGLVLAGLEKKFDASPMVRLIECKLLRPRGARFLGSFTSDYDPKTGSVTLRLPLMGRGAPVLVVNKDANEVMAITHFKDGTGRGELSFWIELPPRPWWSRASRVSVRLSVSIEEISARRPRSQITVTSQEIAWAASKTDIAA